MTTPSARIQETTASQLGTEAELKRAALNGDERAFRNLYQNHHHQVLSFVLSKVKSYPELVPEEIVQDAFTIAFERFEQHNPRRSFCGWVCTIALNKIIDSRKGKSAYPHISLSSENDASPALVDNRLDSNPDRLLENSELQKKIASALAQIPASLRRAFELKHFHRMSLDEIAEIEGTNRGTTKMRICRAKVVFVRALGEILSS